MKLHRTLIVGLLLLVRPLIARSAVHHPEEGDDDVFTEDGAQVGPATSNTAESATGDDDPTVAPTPPVSVESSSSKDSHEISVNTAVTGSTDASKGPEEAVLNGSARRRRSIIAEAIPEENSVESQHQINRAEQSLKIIQKKKNLNSYRSKDRRESERNDEASDDRSSDDYYSVAVERQRASSRAAAAAPGAAAVHGSSSNNNSNSNSNSNSNRRSSRHSLRKQASSKEKLYAIQKGRRPSNNVAVCRGKCRLPTSSSSYDKFVADAFEEGSSDEESVSSYYHEGSIIPKYADRRNKYNSISSITSRKSTTNKSPHHPTRREQQQIVRTVQLLNALLKQQKNQAVKFSTVNNTHIDPASMMLSYENMLTQVNKRRPSLEEDEDKKGEEALSWAAALVLTIPPSILAILLAHHIAKRQTQPLMGGVGGIGSSSRQFSSKSSHDLDSPSDSESSIGEEILRAEGEGLSYAEYEPSLPKIIRRQGRGFSGYSPPRPLASRLLLHGGSSRRPAYAYGRRAQPQLPYGYSDMLDEPYMYDPIYTRHTAARSYERARPLFHEFAEAEGFADAQWVADPATEEVDRHVQELQMHGGL